MGVEVLQFEFAFMSSGLAYQLTPELQEGQAFPARARQFPQLRYMGSKFRLLPWIHDVLSGLQFSSALDAFSGSGCVAFLLKCMGKRVIANDFLKFSQQLALATVENQRYRLTEEDCQRLLRYNPKRKRFIEKTFDGVFFTPQDLRFLDNVWANLPLLATDYHRALGISALVRACVKRQPRGVFTVTGDPSRYDDGRRDLRLSLEEHFLESVQIFNSVVFDNGKANRALSSDVFEAKPGSVDLVYMDPPYVPRADDNCYIKRYHFLEGLASYWLGEGTEILHDTASKKIAKRFTPFSYRRTCIDAFNSLFQQFRHSTLVLSYSSNGYPDLNVLLRLMKRYKKRTQVFEREHRYHFGTHEHVARDRSTVREYLIVGLD